MTVVASKDFRRLNCPVNYLRVKDELLKLESGQTLEALVNDKSKIGIMEECLEEQGFKVITREKLADYWKIVVHKP
jgi:TusA-related sulfurtransferase